MLLLLLIDSNRICGVITTVLARMRYIGGFDYWSGPIKDFKLAMCCFTAYH